MNADPFQIAPSRDHPARRILNDELHARPILPLSAPARLSHVVILSGESGTEQDRALLVDLCRRHNAPPPGADARFHVLTAGDRQVRWERHGEFVAVSVYVAGAASAREWSALTEGLSAWLASHEGERLVAVHLRIEPDEDPTVPTDLGGDAVGSSVAGEEAIAFTAFRIGEDGFSRFVLRAGTLGPGRLGRVAQRLIELESYRMAALLALPIARGATPRLSAMEARLAGILSSNATMREADKDLLDQLTTLAAEAETLAAECRFRFGAARAYGALVKDRLADLGESPLGGLQRIGEFLERRLEPALATVASTERRQRDLAEGITRAGGMLRARVEVQLARQNRDLLEAMATRSEAQLRLSQAVEGLSVFAISYYAVSLIKLWSEGLPVFGFEDAPKYVAALLVPTILVLVVIGVRRARRALSGQSRDEGGTP